MPDVVVYATGSRADTARRLLGAACRATGTTARLELYGTGSLYQRLGPRHGPPPPDIVLWFGAYAARAAAVDGLVQGYQPPRVPAEVTHDPDWKWVTLDYSAIGVTGSSSESTWQSVAALPRLAMPDPERSEVGLSVLLASLDRSRQLDGDVEQGWTWWQQRARAGLVLADDDAGATSLVDDGRASHALTLSLGAPLSGLAPIPHAISLVAASRNLDAARRMLDWLTSQEAGAMLRFSPWQTSSNGLAALLQAAPPLDIDWARQQYTAARRRWSQSGFGPSLDV